MRSKPATEPLDILSVPLHGMQLIEAAAGTGKTWTVVALFLRLILEKGIPVEHILVVTYTTAATEELRDRARKRLVQVREDLHRGQSEDAFSQRLIASVQHPEQAIRRLNHALLNFDKAAIFTIHGFCQRVLMESAFESAMPFETEILTDEWEVLREVVDDFWRCEVYAADGMWVQYLIEKCPTPEHLARSIRTYTGKPYLQILTPESVNDCTALCAEYRRSYVRLHRLWPHCRDEIEGVLTADPHLNRKTYKKELIPTWCVQMDAFLASEAANLNLFKEFSKFTARSLRKAVKKDGFPLAHEFFNACDDLHDTHEALYSCFDVGYQRLKARLLDYAQEELKKRKRHRRIQSYDDLLANLRHALVGPGRRVLADKLCRDYQAALIDEFQDTDPIQYDIFRRIYADREQAVFLVGDPKQAIYSFRGADIFAYLNARSAAQRQYTLDVNWRSVPNLVSAVNALFGSVETPFVFDTIVFNAAQAADTAHSPLVIKGQMPAALWVWFMQRRDGEKHITKTRATESCVAATAGEIAHLLNLSSRKQVTIGGQPLRPGDIAVLVRTHRQGHQIRDALNDLGVPSVQHAQDNVFDSWEAMELERVLWAVAEPGHESLVRAALVTDMLGMKANQVFSLAEAGQMWEDRLERFHRYHRTWREFGFITMMRKLMSTEEIYPRLLGYQDGERRLTNLLHLGELLQEISVQQGGGMESLVKWFAEMRRLAARDDERAQLRLESDADRVKIVTIHKSKGLQYPVVFCPFLWDGKIAAIDSKNHREVVFHDPLRDNAATLDFGSQRQDEHRQRAACEELAESLRLLYVALTRAQYRVYVAWGSINDAGTSALAWLLHRPKALPPETSVNELKAHFNTLTDANIRDRLEQMAKRAPGAIGIGPLPQPPSQAYQPVQAPLSRCVARAFNAKIQPRWRVGSFSALVTGQPNEAPDYDAYDLGDELPTQAEELNIFSFPRGARAGTCLHSVFEHTDFAINEMETLHHTVKRQLQAQGFSEEWTPVVTDMVQRVLSTSLDESGKLRLAGIDDTRRVNEMEFYYPIAMLEDRSLRSLLSDHGFAHSAELKERIERLTFTPLRGFMHGFIDLIIETGGRFYLIDYKSNWLGVESVDYDRDRLPRIMAREGYYLQYLIYAVALHRYLKERLPDYDYQRHFGGVFYLFLRGMHPDRGPSSGIFHDRPVQGLIDSLDIYLSTGRVVN